MDDLKNITELTDAEIDQVYGGFLNRAWKWLQRRARSLLKKTGIKGLTKIIGPFPMLLINTVCSVVEIAGNKKKEDNGGGTASDTGDPRDFHAH